MRPSERLTAAFLAGLGLLALAARAEGAPRVAVLFLAGAAVPVALARAAPRGAVLAWTRDLAPAALVLLAFVALEPVIEAVNPRRFDDVLAAADARWFSRAAAAWRGADGRAAWFTDVAYLAYASFYLLPLGVAVVARARARPEEFERTAFAILLCFWASDVGYLLFPAWGPRVPPAAEHAVLGGGAASDLVRAFLRYGERTTLDAFPSGHTAVSVVAAVLGVRLFPRAATALWAWALAIVFATVYVRAHYVADVVAGLALAVGTLALAPPLSRALGGAPARAAPAR